MELHPTGYDSGQNPRILYHGADWPVSDADARLIAAAPDGHKLLAFLGEYVAANAGAVSLSALMPDSETVTIGEAINAYLAKATHS